MSWKLVGSFIILFAKYIRLIFNLLHLRLSRNEQNKQIIREKIASDIGKSGGITMKVGQLVADVGENKAYSSLLKGIPQRKLKDMLTQFSRPPQQPSLDDFKFIEEKAVAASLGQVHRGELLNGDIVAVKIQYPKIADVVSSELKIAGLIPRVGPAKRWEMDMNAYKKSLSENFKKELNYLDEAKSQTNFRNNLIIDGLHIPKVYQSLCTPKVLVQSWEEGVYLDEVTHWNNTDKLLIGRTLLMTLLKSIFLLREVHGDPHLGNYYYRKSALNKPEVVLLDFGCTINITEQQSSALLQLIIATREREKISQLQCFVALGFDLNKLANIERELPALTKILLKPFIVDEPFDVNKWNIKESFELILEERKWWFRTAGPSDLFLLMRAFQGAMRQLDKLNAKLPWWKILIQAIGEEALQKARNFVLPKLQSYKKPPITNAIASSLNIKITDKDEVIIDLNLPPDAALTLDELIPEIVLNDLISQGWEMNKLREKLISTKLAPQQIYQQKIGGKNYKIWLE